MPKNALSPFDSKSHQLEKSISKLKYSGNADTNQTGK